MRGTEVFGGRDEVFETTRRELLLLKMGSLRLVMGSRAILGENSLMVVFIFFVCIFREMKM